MLDETLRYKVGEYLKHFFNDPKNHSLEVLLFYSYIALGREILQGIYIVIYVTLE